MLIACEKANENFAQRNCTNVDPMKAALSPAAGKAGLILAFYLNTIHLNKTDTNTKYSS